MCVSIIFSVKLADGNTDEFEKRVAELGEVYQYGIGIGKEKLHPVVWEGIPEGVSDQQVMFEVHDIPEPHCACDIDDDIRISSKLGRKSKFFDFVREILEFEGIEFISVLFFQEKLPDKNNIREHLGSFNDFVELLNRWNTWQVEGFEPTRQAYYIADDTPLAFIFTGKRFLH